MLTAEAGRDTVVKIAKLGVRDYLIKPFKGELLVERVSRVVDLQAKTQDAAEASGFDDPITSWWWMTNPPSPPKSKPRWPIRRGR